MNSYIPRMAILLKNFKIPRKNWKFDSFFVCKIMNFKLGKNLLLYTKNYVSNQRFKKSHVKAYSIFLVVLYKHFLPLT